MADVSLDDLIARARLESGLRDNAYYDSDQIIRYLDAGGSELSDVFTQANQHYVIKTFDFTTTGVASAIVTLPDDFQQGHSLEAYPDVPGQTRTIKFLPNWLNRNAFAGSAFALSPGGYYPAYTFLGSELRFYPPQATPAAPFRLYYTPKWVTLAAAITRTFNVNVSDTNSFGVWNLANAAFTSADIGGVLTPAFLPNPRTFNVNPADQPISFTWLMANAAATAGDIGKTLFPAFGAPNTAFNVPYIINGVLSPTDFQVDRDPTTLGTFTNPASGTAQIITFVNTVLNHPYTITGVSSPSTAATSPGAASYGSLIPPALGTATVASSPPGTRATLPSIYAPWSEYLVVYAAIAINTDRQRGTGELERKLGALKARIASTIGQRQEEPQQPPLTRGVGDGGLGGGFGGGWL